VKWVRARVEELSPEEKELLIEVFLYGRPLGPTDKRWEKLQAKGLVERDYKGPKRVRLELRDAVEKVLRPFF
jgi:hypothetical protein